jgi:hypothetical protein
MEILSSTADSHWGLIISVENWTDVVIKELLVLGRAKQFIKMD